MGVPNYTISIAFMMGDETLIGVVHNPILNDTYYARKGSGSFMNGRSISVNNVKSISQSTIGYTSGYNVSPSLYSKAFKHLTKLNVKRVTNFWSPAFDYCLLASGRIEGIINVKNELYDYAASKIIVREAGGLISDLNNRNADDSIDTFIASNNIYTQNILLETTNFIFKK